MTRSLPPLAAATLLLAAAAAALAEESAGAGPAAGADPAIIERIRDNLADRLPGLEPTSIDATPIAGLYEAVFDGQIYYIDESGEYLLDGNLIELDTRTNLTENRLGGIQMALIDEVGEENMLVYEPKEPAERSITIFTDISCGYCRRLHADIDTLLEGGVRVRYLLFPRAGIGSQGHKDLESVWCAKDPLEAMTVAKAGGEIVPASCDNPIESHVALAERVGLRGTPLIYTDSGRRIPGYQEAATLVELVEGSEPLSR